MKYLETTSDFIKALEALGYTAIHSRKLGMFAIRNEDDSKWLWMQRAETEAFIHQREKEQTNERRTDNRIMQED